MTGTHGLIGWSELMTRDPRRACAYYGAVCGWTWDTMTMEQGGDYHVAVAQGKPVAGVMDMAGLPGMDDVPPHWFTYVAVDDVDAAASDTEAAGGKVIRAPWDVPGVGRVAILEDPSGAAVGLIAPAMPQS